MNLSQPFAIESRALEVFASFDALKERTHGDAAVLAQLDARAASEPAWAVDVRSDAGQTVAVIPIHGLLLRRPDPITRLLFGATSTIDVANAIDDAARDPEVSAIVLEIDSPGGEVAGVQAACAAIAQASAVKPVVAVADGTMLSAAYWMGSAASEVCASCATAQIGSIGVVAMHRDRSVADERAGVAVTEIVAGRYKRITSDRAPLTAAGRSYLQAHVDQLYAVFVSDVARYRGVPLAKVEERMADGRVFIGREAVRAGVADRIADVSGVVAELGRGRWRRSGRLPFRGADLGASAAGTDLERAELRALLALHRRGALSERGSARIDRLRERVGSLPEEEIVRRRAEVLERHSTSSGVTHPRSDSPHSAQDHIEQE